MKLPNDIEILSKIEQDNDVISIFKYKNTTAWLSIKNLLTESMYHSDIRLGTGNTKDILSWKGFKTIFSSFGKYILYLKDKEKKSIFLGASTGLFRFEDRILDSYFPYYDLQIKDTIYMYNCGNLNDLNQFEDYVATNNIVIENYLVVMFKKLLAKVLYMRLANKKAEELIAFNTYLKSISIEITDKALLSKYVEFIAGYTLYKLFFKFLNIEKAYVVSAPTKSDMVAALKSLDIEIIDVQHGVIGKLHRGYNFNLEKSNTLPVVDRIDVYNQFWKDELINAGYFTNNQINIVGRLKYDIVKSEIEELNFNYIVFTGQGAFFEKIINFFRESDALLKKKNIKMFYKTHPRELASEIDELKESIDILTTSEIYDGIYTTEELIKNSLAHISVFSSCHFDAVYYNNKTYILDIMDDNIMRYYATNSSGNFIMINNIEEILKNETFI